MKFFKASLLIVLMAALCASCGKDAYDFGGGSAKFALSADYTTSAVGTKSGEELSLDVNDFTQIDYMQFIGEIQDLMNCNFSK